MTGRRAAGGTHSQQFLHAAAENLFPSYRKLATVQSAFDMTKKRRMFENIPVEVSSHLPLQVLLWHLISDPDDMLLLVIPDLDYIQSSPNGYKGSTKH